MKVTADTSDLVELSKRLVRLSSDIEKENLEALRHAVKPVSEDMRRLAPNWTANKHSREKNWAWAGKAEDGTYDRGGATKRDIRIKVVRGGKRTEAQLLVGVSKKRGAVGWRTHFLLHGTKRKNKFGVVMKKYNFMIDALNKNIDTVVKRFESKIRKVIDKNLKK